MLPLGATGAYWSIGSTSLSRFSLSALDVCESSALFPCRITLEKKISVVPLERKAVETRVFPSTGYWTSPWAVCRPHAVHQAIYITSGVFLGIVYQYGYRDDQKYDEMLCNAT